MRRQRRLAKARAEEQRLRDLGIVLEQKARQNAFWYELKLWLFCRLGCAFVVLFFATLLGLLGGLVYILIRFPVPGMFFVVIPLGGYVLITLDYLFLKPPGMAAYAISEQQAPDLYARVRQIQERLGAPVVHKIYLTPWIDAAAGFRRKFGVWGPRQNELVLGLPLIAYASEEEGDFLVAHELAHLRQRTIAVRSLATLHYWTWVRDVMAHAGERKHPIYLFAQWYVPRLAARTWAQSRLCEYVSDRKAAEVAGSEPGAALLMKTIVLSQFAHCYGDQLWATACEKPEPPKDAVEGLLHALEGLTPDFAERALAERLSDPNDGDYTHPSLSQRIEALGAEDLVKGENLKRTAERACQRPGESWAQRAFGENLDIWVSRASGVFWSTAYASWTERYSYYRYLLRIRERIQEEYPPNALTQAEVHYVSGLLEELRCEEDEALESFREAYKLQPDCSRYAFELGLRLAQRKDKQAVELLRHASKDVGYSDKAYAELATMHESLGERGAAEQCFAAHQRVLEAKRKVTEHCDTALLRGDLQAATPTPYEELAWIDQLILEKRALAAYLVELKHKAIPHMVARMVIVEIDAGVLPSLLGGTIEHVVREQLHPITNFFVASPVRRALFRKLQKVGIRPFWTRDKGS